MTLTISRTVIGGDVLENDYVVKEDGYGCGRIKIALGPNARTFWHWVLNPPVPIHGKRDGQAASREEAQEQWKAAWALARPTLTEDDVKHWHELEDSVRERFWRLMPGLPGR